MAAAPGGSIDFGVVAVRRYNLPRLPLDSGRQGTFRQEAGKMGLAFVSLVGTLVIGGEAVHPFFSMETAIYNGDRQLIADYLAGGGSPNDRVGFDPCHADVFDSLLSRAVGMNQPEIVRLLLRQGAWVNGIPGEYGFPLVWAAGEGDLKTVKLLVERGARLDMQRPGNGVTALHFAIYADHPEVVRYLIEQGADTSRRTLDSNPWGIYNATPLEIARRLKHVECEAVLLSTKEKECSAAPRRSFCPAVARFGRIRIGTGFDHVVRLLRNRARPLSLALGRSRNSPR